MKIDLVFLIALFIVVAYVFILYKVEQMADTTSTPPASSPIDINVLKNSIKQIYNADVDSIRILNSAADQLNKDGINTASSLILKDTLTVNNTVNVKSLFVNNEMYDKKANYLFYPEDAIIYHNILDCLRNKIINKNESPTGWNDTTYAENNMWNARTILNIGGKNKFPNGLKITVPINKNVVWLRLLNERWNSYQIYTINGVDLGNFTSGKRNLNPISPDGGASEHTTYHIWMPIPVPGPGDYIICTGNNSNDNGNDGWISGIAFTSNPWNLALNSAVAYFWTVNKGDALLTWVGDNWQNDHHAYLPNNKIITVNVPIVPSGKDKLFYIVEHNNDWNGLMHKSILVGNVPLERLRTTWNHPLARHVNSKLYSRFAATIIPENLTRDKRFIPITIDLTNANENINIREIGTVDLY